MIRVALRNNTAGCYQSDLGLGHINNCLSGSHTVKARHLVLGLKLFACKLLNEHLNGTLRTSLLLEEVHTKAVRHVTFLSGSADLLALGNL